MEQSEWKQGMEEYEKSHKGYTDFTNWRRGKCHLTLRDAVDAYKNAHMILDIDVLKTLDELR